MLKILSMGAFSGYQIMKRIEVLTSKKPSAGSVYPLLKSMQDQGWLVGKKTGKKTVYELTTKGKKIVQKHDLMKEQVSQKVRESLLLAQSTFEDFALALSNDFHVGFTKNLDHLSPLLSELSRLQATNVDDEKIKAVIANAKDELQKMK
jgi:DNA-binding PadR family transcriptional regulator